MYEHNSGEFGHAAILVYANVKPNLQILENVITDFLYLCTHGRVIESMTQPNVILLRFHCTYPI